LEGRVKELESQVKRIVEEQDMTENELSAAKLREKKLFDELQLLKKQLAEAQVRPSLRNGTCWAVVTFVVAFVVPLL
jgi:hypothetical protein